jgi:hypothetical protein
MRKRATELLLHALFHRGQAVDGADEIDDQAVAGDLRELVFTCHRLVILVEHDQDEVGRPEIDSDVQAVVGC